MCGELCARRAIEAMHGDRREVVQTEGKPCGAARRRLGWMVWAGLAAHGRLLRGWREAVDIGLLRSRHGWREKRVGGVHNAGIWTERKVDGGRKAPG